MAENLIDITVTRPDGTTFALQDRGRATKVTSAVQKWSLNDEDTVSVTVQSPYPQTFEIGDAISVFGRDYKLNRLPKVSKTGAHEFTYDLEFEGIQYDLMRVTYDLTIDTTNNELQDVQGDSLTGSLERFMTVLVANANRVFSGKWALGECPETDGDVTLTFGEDDNCLSALQTLCSEDNFDCEFAIESVDGVYVINIYDEVGQVLPYTFEYGRGKGLYELTRDNVSSSNIVTRLKVYGSTENITSKYRADRLCLPGKSKGESYIEKEEMVEKYGVFEGRKNFDDIKPTFTGSVESLGDDIYSFIDTKFPFDIQADDDNGDPLYMITGVSPKVHFNTGNLAGYEFEISSYDHAKHLFKLVKQTDDRGDVFPSETSAAFRFSSGDEYKVLDLAYPADIEAEAEAKLEEKGNEYYEQNSQPKVQYGLSVTPAYLESLVTDAGTYNIFEPGDYIQIVDDDIAVDKAIRIKSFERNILDPYDYTLTISDIQTDAGIATRIISDLVEIDKVLSINNLKDPARARANWRTSRELLEMVFDPEGDYYSEKIKPLSIETTMLAVGAKSMQFILTGVVFSPNYGGDVNVLKITGGTLSHYTISETGVVNWTMAGGEISGLDSSTAYYIYARCARDGAAGTFVLSTSQITVDSDASYYHFWVGVLNSVDPDLQVRMISLTYGATTINGRMITTGCIQSTDGTTYFDLDGNEVVIGDKLTYKDGVLTLDCLFANNANIGGWILKDNKLISQKGTVDGQESTDYKNESFIPNVTLDGENGVVTMSAGTGTATREISLSDTQIVGKYKKVVNLIISNEEQGGLSALSDEAAIPATLDCSKFSPSLTDDYLGQVDSQEADFNYNNVVLNAASIGVLSKDTVLSFQSALTFTAYATYWYEIEDGLEEYDVNNVYKCMLYFQGLQLWLYKDGVAHTLVAEAASTAHLYSGYSTTTRVQVALEVVNGNITIAEGGVYALKLVCETLTVGVDPQDYDHTSKQESNGFINIDSYTLHGYSDYLETSMPITGASIAFPGAISGLNGFVMYRNGMVYNNDSGSMRFDENNFTVMYGSYGLRISADGVQYTKDGGGTWTAI